MFKESRKSILQFLCLPARNIGSSYTGGMLVIGQERTCGDPDHSLVAVQIATLFCDAVA